MSVLEVPAAHKNLISSNILVTSISGIGLGHLGSNILSCIAKLGAPEFYLYDGDEIERRNLSGSAYNKTQIELKKAEALKDIIIEGSFEPKLVYSISKHVSSASDLVQETDVYIISTDSIESRLEIFNSIRELHKKSKKKPYLIDMRSRGKIAEIYGIPMEDEVAAFWYEQNIQSRLKDPTPPVHCNEANIIQNTNLTTSIAIQIFSDILDGERELLYFRLDITNYKIHPITISLETFEKELQKKKLKEPCEYCNKKHRSIKLKERCKKKSENTPKKIDDKLPSREDLFRHLQKS